MGKVKVIFNGEDRLLLRAVSYAELSQLANIDPARRPSITYELPTGGSGSLKIGMSISLTAGTIINVRDTSKA